MAAKKLPTPGSLLDRVVDSVDLTKSGWLIFNYKTQLQAIVSQARRSTDGES